MLIQLANMLAGFALAAPMFKHVLLPREMTVADNYLRRYHMDIGSMLLLMGLAAFADRAFFHFDIVFFGATFPQAVTACLVGSMLAAELFSSQKPVKSILEGLRKHGEWIGFVALLIGFLSLVARLTFVF